MRTTLPRVTNNPLDGTTGKVANEATGTRGARARFSFLENLNKDHLQGPLDADGDDM